MDKELEEAFKQIAEQMNGVVVSSTDMTSRLILRLINLKKLSPGEGVLILGDLVGHQKDLAQRNSHLQGSALVYEQVAKRLEQYKTELENETGASVKLTSALPQ